MSRQVRVVVVDDDEMQRFLWSLLLSRSGRFEVVGQAANGSEALEVCGECRPDAVVTDWHMPEVDGLTLARRLHDDHPKVVVVLCSSTTLDQVPPFFTQLGITYLHKVESAELPQLLDRLVTADRGPVETA